jgi:hypothetical protein
VPEDKEKKKENLLREQLSQQQENRWGCKHHWTHSNSQEWMLRDMHVDLMMGPSRDAVLVK